VIQVNPITGRAGRWALLLLITLLVGSVPVVRSSGPDSDIIAMPASPLDVDLELSSMPRPGQSVQLTVTVSAVEDAPNTSVEVTLPEGVQLEDGKLSWQGNLGAGKSIAFLVTLRFDREGEFEITATANSPIDALNTRIGEGAVAVNVGASTSQLGLMTQSFAEPPAQVKVVLGGVEPLEEAESAAADAPAAPEGTDACGTVRAYGWAYVKNSSSGGWVPAQNVRVELWDDDSWSGNDYLGSDIADSNGYWSVGPVSQSDEWFSCGLDLYNLFVYDASWGRVENGSGNRYSWKSGTVGNVGNGTYSFGGGGIPYGLEEYRARNIYFTIRRAWLALLTRAHVPAAKATVQYRHGDNSNQTWPHFSRNTQKIYLPGVGQDWSNYGKQKTLLHELGHHYHWELYGNWLPTTYCPSPHYVNGASHDNCAWTEGFATFVALYVNQDPNAYGYNYETLPSCSSFTCGSDVEGRVTASLYDMWDSNNEGPQDVYTAGSSGGKDKIWDTIDVGGHHSRFWNFWTSYRNRYPKYSAGHDPCLGVRAIRQNNGDGSNGGHIWFNEWVDMGNIPTIYMTTNSTKYIDLWVYADDYECRDSDLTYVIDYKSNNNVAHQITASDFIRLDSGSTTGWTLIRAWAGDGLMWDYDYFWVSVSTTTASAGSPDAGPPGLANSIMEPTPEGTPQPMITPTPEESTPVATVTSYPPPSTTEPTNTPAGTPTDTPTPTATPVLDTPEPTEGADPTDVPTATPTNTPTAVPTSFPPTPTPEPPTLGIDPNFASLKPHEVMTFTAQNGDAPYTWYGSGGVMTDTGSALIYQAGDERGNFQLTVRDNTGDESTSRLLIGGLEIMLDPEGQSTHIAVGDNLQFKVDDLSASVGDPSGGRGPFLWILDGVGPQTPVGTIRSTGGGVGATFLAEGNGTALVTAYGTDPDGKVVNSNSILVIVGNTLEIPDTKGVAGQPAHVRVNLNNIVDRPISSFGMTIIYPTDLLSFTGVEPTFRTANFTVGANEATPGEITIILTSLTGEVIQPGQGSILDLQFDVVAAARGLYSTTNFEFKPQSVLMLDNQVPPQEIPVQTSGGVFTVVQAGDLPHNGDVDGNGVVNVRDLALSILIFLDRYAPSTEEFAAADITPLNMGDGAVNVADALKIFNKALGKPISLNALLSLGNMNWVSRFLGLAQTGEITLRVPDRASAITEEELILPIQLVHPDDAVGGLDVTLVFTSETGVYTPTLQLATRAEQMRSSLNVDTAGRAKVILYSPDTVQAVSAGDGELLSLNFGIVDADASLQVGVVGSTVSDVNGDLMEHAVDVYDPTAPSDDPETGTTYLPVVIKSP
jgi:hypothetical protein